MQMSLVSFIQNANISFPLKTVFGAQHISQMTWGDAGPNLMEVLSFNPEILLMLLGIFLIFYFMIIVSHIKSQKFSH